MSGFGGPSGTSGCVPRVPPPDDIRATSRGEFDVTGMLNAPPAGPLPPPSTPTAFRKSVAKLSDAEVADLRRAFAAVKNLEDERGFWYFAGWHGIPFNWCEHHTQLFLPWHRQYLYYFELALQSQVPGVTLPWWDWTTSGSIPDAFTEPNDNPLLPGEFHVYRSSDTQQAPEREPGQNPTVPAPPHTNDWIAALEQPTFLAFQKKIETIHDDMHVWTGGIMVDIEWAAYDPLFFAHHTMVDRAWRILAAPPPRGAAARGAARRRATTQRHDRAPDPRCHRPGLRIRLVAGRRGRDPSGRIAMTQTWTSSPLQIAVDPQAPWSAAELTFLGIEHDGPSYTVRVFLDPADHPQEHRDDADEEPAARFTVFGHGNCWGDEGHCEVPRERVSPFDYRHPHPLTPYDVELDVTAALRGSDSARVVVTALATSVDPDVPEPLRFRSLALATFD